MAFKIPETFHMADYFLDARVREGKGDRPALRGDFGTWSYARVQERANRFGHVLRDAGVHPEQRVLLILPDGPDFVAAFFGTLKIGAVVVMVNPDLAAESFSYFLEYTRAAAAVVHPDALRAFRPAASSARHLKATIVADAQELAWRLEAVPDTLENFPGHRDDAAIWLFSGGTTGRPKAVVQTHASFANTTECYAKGVLGYRETDVTLSVPKLFFGYATGSNLLFPFSVGGCSLLFPERCTPERLFAMIAAYRPTILINVPTIIQKLVSHPEAAAQDLSSLRFVTSAGEALPVELHERWMDLYDVEVLDGLGTAEMWHVFISNRPGAARPGTLGSVVPGFEVKACDEEGREVPPGETGWLWVRGGARAIAYWQHQEKTEQAFRGAWYVSGDLIAIDREGFVTYGGRGDEMLKVGGKWLAPQEVEGCLLLHPAVAEAAVVGVADDHGLVKPVAHVVARERRAGLEEELKAFVRERLDAYKHPREVRFVDALPRTHLGKVDRGKLRRG
jgi:benzoate-CoA ligase family protein